MPLIKLDAIDSTNDYLKELAKADSLENFTVVLAENQTGGRGQMGAKWHSERGKNLTMSIFVDCAFVDVQHIFDFNVAVALAVYESLSVMQIPKLNIKWPNDIMADSKKVGGILIENSLKVDGSFTSVVGIGLNLNQNNFDHLPKATSLFCLTNQIYDTEKTALLISESLQQLLPSLVDEPGVLWKRYYEVLFKKDKPAAFEDVKGKRFMGIIRGVNQAGMLMVELEDETVNCYNIKEIQLLL